MNPSKNKLIKEELINFATLIFANAFFLAFNHKFNKNYFQNFFTVIIVIIFFEFLAILIAIINKKIKNRFIQYINFIVYPKFWALFFIMGIYIYNEFFIPDYKFYLIISFYYLLSASIVFLPNDKLRKIKEIVDYKNNNLFNGLFLTAIFSYIIIGNPRYYIRVHGISQNGAFRLSTGMIIFSYYAIIGLIAYINTWEDKNSDE